MSIIHVAKDLKLVPIETLLPYEKNARRHSDAQLDQIAASIKEFGFTNPILIDGDRGIVAGHGRLAAAKLLRLKEVPVIELSHLTPAQKRAYIIADNKLALNADWDMQLLASEVASLGGELDSFDAIGFDDDELSNLLAGLEDLGDPEPVQPQTVHVAPPAAVAPPVEQADEAPNSSDVADEHWQGMPDFTQEDRMPHRTIYVHFENDADIAKFAMLVKQSITDKTKSIWFPEAKKAVVADKVYEADNV